MIKGFRDFIMRGNVLELAIAVVVGTAFTTLIKTITDALIQPLVNLFLGGGVKGGKVIVSDQVFNFGAVINAIIFFLITAAVVYFLIVAPMNAWNDRRRRGTTAEPAALPADVELLTEIRDLLRAEQR